MRARSRKKQGNTKGSAKKTRKGLTLKKALRAAARALYKHLIELPEKERQQNIASLERAVAKKLRRGRRRK